MQACAAEWKKQKGVAQHSAEDGSKRREALHKGKRRTKTVDSETPAKEWIEEAAKLWEARQREFPRANLESALQEVKKKQRKTKAN